MDVPPISQTVSWMLEVRISILRVYFGGDGTALDGHDLEMWPMWCCTHISLFKVWFFEISFLDIGYEVTRQVCSCSYLLSVCGVIETASVRGDVKSVSEAAQARVS